jgi:hypothetical protein
MNKTCKETLCQKCIHQDVCRTRFCHDEDDERAMTYCVDFKDKSRYIELPCAVGDVVWDKNGEPHKVISIEWYSSKVMHLHCEHRTFSVGKRSIGKTVFLTKEEAEQALQTHTSGELNYVKAQDLYKDSPGFKAAIESLKRL